MKASVLGLVALVAQSALAHPFHQPAALLQTSVSEPHDPRGDALEYHYSLFARIAHEAPAPNQPELFACMKAIAWVQGKLPGAPAPNVVLGQAESLYARLRSQYPIVTLAWRDNTAYPEGPLPTIALTLGMSKPILVEVHNYHAKAVRIMPVPSAEYPATCIPAGATRTILLSLAPAADLETRTTDLALAPADVPDSRRVITVPVSVTAPAVVKGTVIDSENGKVWPGRVYAKGSDGLYHFGGAFTGNTTLSEKYISQLLTVRFEFHRLPFFYTDGTFEVAVPAGETELTLERGFEHTITTQKLSLAPGETRAVTLSSGRFCDMRRQGWVSGDTHIHWVKNSWDVNEDIALLAMVQRAEDLRVANNLTLYQYRPEQQGGVFVKPDQFGMGPVPGHNGPDYVIHMAEEYRNDEFYGHLIFLNIAHLVQPIATGQGSGGPAGTLDFPLNRTAILDARSQGGISIEAHNLGPCNLSDVPVNVISGLADSLDQFTPEHYYRFLDCGVRLPLTNGSDHPARVAGCARAYVKVDGDFTYEKWIEGIRRARTFTTSGPLLFLTVNGADIGDEVRASKGDALKVKVRALSRHPIGSLQVVANGRVIRTADIPEKEGALEFDWSADESGWLVARCSRNHNYSAIEEPDVAHTSAVYVTVDGKRTFRPESARYWIENMKRHAADVAQRGHYADDAQRQDELDYIGDAVRTLESAIAEQEAAK